MLRNQVLQRFKDLKIELVRQGRQYAKEAMSYREKIAQLALGFIKDGSVVRPSASTSSGIALNSRIDLDSLLFSSDHTSAASCPQTETDISVRYGGKTTWTWVRFLSSRTPPPA